MAIALSIVCFSMLFAFLHKMVVRPDRSAKLRLVVLAVAAALSGGLTTVSAHAQSATSTALTVASGGAPATSVASGSVLTLTASVKAGATPITIGQVNFCDAIATYCTDVHVLGTAQLTSAGTAVFRFRPGIGSHSYKAVFSGTNTDGGSVSEATSVTVAGTSAILGTATSIGETGSWGNYTLTATVTEVGGTATPGGSVSFQDASNGNAVVGTGLLGAGTQGFTWLGSQLPLSTTTVEAVASTDFNGDGISDLALVDYGGSVEILLGKGDGTFTQMAPATPVGSGATAIAIADFNSDGKPDLAVLNNYSDTVTVLLGNGDGTFTATPSSPATSPFPSGIAAGDFNGDGITDLALVGGNAFDPGAVTILLGNGDGTFTATSQSTAAGDSPAGIVAGDFNGDGKTDLAVIDQQDYTLTILLGKGDGTFMPAAGPQVTSYATSIAMADFNGDGKMDLVVTCSNGGSVIVLLGNGDGTFIAAPAFPVPTGVSPVGVVVADFNDDNVPDIAILDNSYTTGGARIFPGNGNGTFFPGPIQPSAMSSPAVFVGGDFNGDGRPDLVVASNFISESLTLLLTEPTESTSATANVSLSVAGQHLVDASYGGDSNYTSSTSGSIPLWGILPATTTTLALSSGGAPATSVSPGSVVTFNATVAVGSSPVTTGQVNFCDASANSCTDIHLLGSMALTSSGTATFKYVPGPGAHSYTAQFVQNGYGMGSASAILPLTVGPAPAPAYSNTTAITYGGIPGEYSLTATEVGFGGSAPPTGNISFLDTSFGNTSLATASLGTSTQGMGWLISETPAIAGNNPIAEVTGDFNGDAIPDLLILWNPDLYNAGPYSITTLFGKGDGTFTTGPTAQPQGIQSTTVMIAGDVNGDGKTDLVILNSDYTLANNILTLLGKGDGTFAPTQSSPIDNPPNQGGDVGAGFMAIADFNGDGKMDLAVVGAGVIGGVTIALGNGDGTFTDTGAHLESNSLYGSVAIGDFNGDGIPDLVATQAFESSSANIFLGKGDGTFTTSSIPLPPSSFSGPVVVGDFNGDGRLDLAVADALIGGVTVFLGNGDGTFSEAPGIPNSGASLSLIAGDFNHDGKLDLAGIDNYFLQIDLYLGGGDGTFTETVTTPNIGQDAIGVNGPFAIVPADFNQDGVVDLAMLTRSVTTASILLTQPTQTAGVTVNNIAPVGAGTHNVEASYSGDANYSASVSGTVPLTAGLPGVTFSLPSGTYSSVQTLTLSESFPGATIYYAASGTVNTSGFVPYTAPIPLTQGGAEYIEAYATESGYQDSNSTTANYYLNLPAAPAPIFAPVSGSYIGVQSVTIVDAAPGATIYYTTNGSLPTTSSNVYTGPISVTTSATVVAIAVASGYSTSAPASAQYIIASSPSSFIYTVAGNGFYGFSGDGGPAQFANLNQTESSIVDSAGNLYIADSANNLIRKVSAGTGVITTIAGTGTAGYSGDNGAATRAKLSFPTGLSLDSAGDLYFADESNNVVRMIASTTGVITTVAGSGIAGYGGDGSMASTAQLSYPSGTAFDGSGNLYIADTDNARIRKVAKTGTITTVAGNGYFGYSGDGGSATLAELDLPRGVTVDASGNLYIADSQNNLIRKVTASTGVISTVAGTTSSSGFGYFGGYSGDGGPATSAQLYSPSAVIVDGSGNLYIADTFNDAIREVTSSNGIINTIIGTGPSNGCYGFGGDGGPASGAAICYPYGISMDAAGDLYIADTGYSRIRMATASALPPTAPTSTPTVAVAAGTYASPQMIAISDSTPGASIYVTTDGTSPTTLSAGYNGPIDASGNVKIQAIAVAPGDLTSAPLSASYTITSPPASVINTVAGSGVNGFGGAGGPAKGAQVGQLSAIVVDKAGDLFFTDSTNNVVWMASAASGKISIVAGSGIAGFSGDGGPATSAQLYFPNGLAMDGAGNLYIADSANNVIRRVDAVTGNIETVAGVYGGYGYPGQTGDGGPATSAYLNYPQGLTLDAAGNLYIADSGDNAVRMVSASSGIITSIAGNGSYGFSGEGGVATSASLAQPNTLALDKAGNVYIGSVALGRVCKLTTATGILTTVAGNGNASGSSGDGELATSVEIYPLGLALDQLGNLYISNSPGAIREVSAATGLITKIIGNGYPGYSGDGGSAAAAQIQVPQGIVFDGSGNLYIADGGNRRVRQVSTPVPTVAPSISPASGTYTSTQTVTITDSLKGAIIYYTTDGTAPTNASSVYSDPVQISTTTTLQAIAIAPGLGQSATASATYTIHLPVAPTIVVTPSATSITTAQALSIVVTVSGPSGSPTPTGSVTLSGDKYSAMQNLAAGTVRFNVAAGALPPGADTLTATYAPDAAAESDYAGGTQTVTVTVTPATGGATATVTLTPSAASITDAQPVSVKVSVAGATGESTPTGSVTLSGGAYSSAQSLSGGIATFAIPAGGIGAGTDTLTADYSGDTTFAANSGTTVVTVAPVVVTIPSPTPVAPGGSTSATATFSAGSTYSGTMNLTCSLTASPTGAQSLPTCGLSPASVMIAAGGKATTTLTVSTTAAATTALETSKPIGWTRWGGGGLMALALMLGVPSLRRRRFVFLIAICAVLTGGMVGCGGGGSPSATPPPVTPATTAGSYTFTVVGVDSSNSKMTASANVTVAVQ